MRDVGSTVLCCFCWFSMVIVCFMSADFEMQIFDAGSENAFRERVSIMWSWVPAVVSRMEKD